MIDVQRTSISTTVPAPKKVKRLKMENFHKDLISQLPDDILVFITSSFTVKEAARTSVLSRRWLNLWTYIRRLDFDPSKMPGQIPKPIDTETEIASLERDRVRYVEFVNRVLQLHRGSDLEEFNVCFDLTRTSSRHIDNWLYYAMSRRVEKLELNLCTSDGLEHLFSESYIYCGLDGFSESYDHYRVKRIFSNCYTFPAELFYLSGKDSPVESHALYGTCSPRAFLDVKSLRTLSLKSVKVTGEVLQFFLHTCPILETLVVHGSGDLVDLEVSGSSLALRHLEVCWCPNLVSVRVYTLPTLVSLKVTELPQLFLCNVPSLIEVSVTHRNENIVKVTMSKLNSCLRRLVALTMHAFRIEENPNIEGFPKLLSSLKQLKLVMIGEDGTCLMGFTYLIRASPNLEKFVLMFNNKTVERQKRDMKRAVSCPLPHLKEVELLGYCGRTCELEILNYLLENAVALEKITINPHQQQFVPLSSKDSCEREESVKFVEEQLKGMIPPHIEFVVVPP